MNNVEILPTAVRATTRRNSTPARFLYAMFALVLTGLVIWGFQHFYFQGKAYPGRPLTPPIRTLVILHGTAMGAWILLFVLQPLLIAIGNRRLHMALGKVGAIIAAAIVILGMKLAIAATRVNPPDHKLNGLVTKQFMAVPVISIVIFGALVAAAVYWRRRAELHRPLMLLATLAVLSAAVARITPLSQIYENTVWERLFGPFLWTLVLALVFLFVKWIVTRKFDRIYAAGCVGLILASAFIMWIAPTSAWDAFATFLLK